MTHDRIAPHDWKKWTIAIAGFLAVSILGLWAFNMLAELFSMPQAQYKHAVAAFALLFASCWAGRWALVGRTRADIHRSDQCV